MRAPVTEIDKGRDKQPSVAEQPFGTPTAEGTRLTEQDILNAWLVPDTLEFFKSYHSSKETNLRSEPPS